jgi:hypothetical protein
MIASSRKDHPVPNPKIPDGMFKFFSLGTVAENKKLDSHTIRVTPIEQLQMLDGEIKSDPTTQEVEGKDSDGKSYTATTITDNAIEADWFPLDAGDRMTSPDVRRGERVLIWRYGDSDDYYWTPTGLDNHLRKLETVVHMYSATADESVTELTADNAYVVSVSTHKKAITITTSTANGEPTKWCLQLNTADGRLMFTEDGGNTVEIDAKNSLIELLNADKSRMSLDKTNIYVYADDGLFIETGKSVEIKTQTVKIDCKDYTLNCTNHTVNSTTTKIATTTATISGTTITLDAPTSKITGNLAVTGSLTTGPQASIGGLTIADGMIQCQGIVSTGPVRAPNID